MPRLSFRSNRAWKASEDAYPYNYKVPLLGNLDTDLDIDHGNLDLDHYKMEAVAVALSLI